MEDLEAKYGLDLHCTMILEEYQEKRSLFEKMRTVVLDIIHRLIEEARLDITAVESRIKKEESLAGKLERKGNKYMTLDDLTDILGVRIITSYSDDVDKISAIVDRAFEVDWQNSVDKRKMHELDSFGYNSLHYICRIPKSLYFDPEYPEMNELRFEVQMRSALQHVWATMNHDTGYKSGVEVPREYLRSISQLAGLLELADEQFSLLRSKITDYRRQVQLLVHDGKFDEVQLNGDTFRSYLEIGPFDKLIKRIAAINQAEVHRSSMMPYLTTLKNMGFKTLGDIEKLIKDYEDDAYQLALYQIGNTDLDIISSTIAIQDILEVYIVENGGGELGLVRLFEEVNGPSSNHQSRAQRLLETVSQLPFMNKKK